eukprot:CAMPEP_0178387948 /NCGR_PEP_ID=MMETSP0689_2-20121128/9340_1 /TAXON_ID=160604 /ORGANISM="Amphidinium massartii, Strain CS-259" /LENGTH=99 /DNA_ID=CAMNT_0020008335 /DNA_START=598 /DNA_END=896 /DNA_ORIENTATION=-
MPKSSATVVSKMRASSSKVSTGGGLQGQLVPGPMQEAVQLPRCLTSCTLRAEAAAACATGESPSQCAGMQDGAYAEGARNQAPPLHPRKACCMKLTANG